MASEKDAPERVWIDKNAYNLRSAKERGGGNYYFTGDSMAIEYIRADKMDEAIAKALLEIQECDKCDLCEDHHRGRCE